MICPNCGTNNDPNNKFCLKCGTKLNNDGNVESQNGPIAINSNAMPNPTNVIPNQVGVVNTESNNVNSMTNNVNNNVNVGGNNSNGNSTFNYFKCLLYSLIKPIDTLDKENNNLTNFKNSGIITLIISLFIMLANLIKTVISTGYVKETSLFGETTKASFNFELIKELNYVDLILKDFLIILGIILGITIIFYLGSLVVKKGLNFSKTLAIVSMSVLPVTLAALVLGPILGLIWVDLNTILIAVGGAYSLTLLYTLIENELNLSGNIKAYYFAACFAILFIIGYYIISAMIASSITDTLGDMGSIFDMFN